MPGPEGTWWDQLCKAATESSWWVGVALGVLGSLLAAFVVWGLVWLYRRIRRTPTVDERFAEIERHLEKQDGVLDGLARRPDEMRPPHLEPGRDLSGGERKAIAQATEVLTKAPDLISEGRLDEAEKQVAAQERAVAALHERLSKEASAATKAAVAVLLARADIQLGTIAFERRQYARAADICQRAVAWAQQGNDEETLRLALYQTGVGAARGGPDGLRRSARDLHAACREGTAGLRPVREDRASEPHHPRRRRGGLGGLREADAGEAERQAA